MPDLTHKDIESLNVDIVLYYDDHKISYYRQGKTFIITIFDKDSDKTDTHIVTDEVFNDCILDLLNIVLKPYLKKFINNFENNWKKFDNYLHIGYYIYTEVFKYNDSIRR